MSERSDGVRGTQPPGKTMSRWTFFGEGSLSADPTARAHEKRGRKWLAVSYLFCPCHIPITLALIGAAFGGTALGAALTGNALRVGVVLTSIYALVLWRGFRQIRRAKRIEAAGGAIACTSAGCSVAPARTAITAPGASK